MQRLSLTAPGVRVAGSGSYQQGGSATARFTAEVEDVARAGDNAGKLLGQALPALAGRASVDATLAGTAAAPVVTARLDAPRLLLGGASAAGIEAHVDVKGPFRPGELHVAARVQRLSSGGQLLAQDLSLEAGVAPAAGEAGAAAGRLSATGLVHSLGKEPVSVEAAATLPRERRTLRITQLSLGYPGTRYALESPATLTFEGPRVDRLALDAGPRRIAVEGGLGPRRQLDAHVEVVRFDLSKLPAGLLPAQEAIAGEIGVDGHATGPLSRPRLEARVELRGGAFRSERGLSADATVRYDGGARRAAVRLSLARGPGGTIDLDADVPVPYRGRLGEPVSATFRAGGVPIPALLQLASVNVDQVKIAGRLGADVRLAGTVGAPTVHAGATVAEGAFRDLDGIDVSAVVNAAADASATVDVRLASRPAVQVVARAPLSLAALAADPQRTVRGLLDARVAADATLPGLELAAISGKLGVPAGLGGFLKGEVRAAGRPAALRGTATLDLTGGTWGGYTGVNAQVEAAALDDRVEARVAAQLQAQQLLRAEASLRTSPDRLKTRAGLDAAGLLVDATIPAVNLEKAAAPSGVTLGGVVEAKLHVEGTLARPRIQLDASGQAVHVKGRPVGDVRVAAHAAGERATADLTVDPPAGGKLIASAAVTVPISLDVTGKDLRSAPARVTVRAEAVDLGFTPAILPDVIRSAAGKLDADVTATGPLARLTPRGKVQLSSGRIALLEYGDWSGIVLDASMTEDAIELGNLEAHRGAGSLQVRGGLRGLTTASAKLDGRLDANRLTITQAGMDLATVTVGVRASGTYRDDRLDVRLDVPDGLLRLADKLPRELQSLEKRPDIVVGPRPPSKKEPLGPPPGELPGGKPLTVVVRLVSPGRFLIQRVTPRVNVELKSDVTYEHQANRDFMSGSVDVVRGFVEPLSDRRFEIKRGRLTFTGGPPRAALVDAEAAWDATSQAVTVTVNVSGPVTKPQITLRSQPPLDEGQIAMLIATGQTELKAGGGGSAGAAQNDVTRSAAQQVGFTVFNTFIRDQLPFATGDVSLDASAAKVSGYLPGTKIYVGFTRRFDANQQLGENDTEVRMEYSITPHWTLEGRWGNRNTGGASLVWFKDY